MRRLKIPVWLPALALSICSPSLFAQKYPEKGVRLVVGNQTGVSYILGLLVSEKLRDLLGQPVTPDFRAGAGGNIAAEIVAKSRPDGYTLLLTSPTIAISPSLYQKLGYDTFQDFTPITLLGKVPNVLVVHSSVPARSLSELVKLAKAHPGKLNFGSGGLGTGSQLGSELFKTLTNINIVHVRYKSATVAMTAMSSGEVDIVTSTVPGIPALLDSGKIRALAVMTQERVPTLPKVPTTAEAGLPELVVITWYGLLGPAGMKADVLDRLNGDVVRLMNSPETRTKLAQMEIDASTGTPAEFAQFVRAEYEKWGRVIKAANIRVEQ